MKSIELFAGIGGIALAAEWAGIETVAFCERESFCQKVLNKNFPGVPIFDDVCTLNRQLLEEKGVIEPGGTIDIISGDSLASLTVLPGSEKARKMTATSGRKCLGSSKSLNPLGLLVKTLLTSQTWNSTARYLTWKTQVTKGNRLLYCTCAVDAKHRRDRTFVVAYSDSFGRMERKGQPKKIQQSREEQLQREKAVNPSCQNLYTAVTKLFRHPQRAITKDGDRTANSRVYRRG
ncbi:DNA cytosine methyltransferase [Bacillus velezensis]